MEDDFEFEVEGKGDLPMYVHMTAGSFAGVMEHVLLFPIDTIKVGIILFRLIYKLIIRLN